jgi:hypothetical protein
MIDALIKRVSVTYECFSTSTQVYHICQIQYISFNIQYHYKDDTTLYDKVCQ